MKILFFGSDEFAIPSLKSIAQSKHKILGVVTKSNKPAGRGQKITPCPVAVVAKELGFKLFQPEILKTEESLAPLLSLKPDILVVVAYGQFLPTTLINAISHKALNLHPSLLPKYRGAAPMQWALLNGEKTTGVTTAIITKEMDAGDIYLQQKTEIDEDENFVDLQNRLSLLGAELLLKTLDGIERGTLKPKPQNTKQVTFAPLLTKEEGHLDWKESAWKLHNKIRALNPWPGAFCYLDEKRLKIFRTLMLEREPEEKPGIVVKDSAEIWVACGQGLLCLLEVQLEGKTKMSIKEFVKGYPIPVGTIFK